MQACISITPVFLRSAELSLFPHPTVLDCCPVLSTQSIVLRLRTACYQIRPCKTTAAVDIDAIIDAELPLCLAYYRLLKHFF